jgi:hypothetical protein
VVGESHRQDNLWELVGGRTMHPVHHSVVAVLVPEPDNPYDANAIAVHIGGRMVGFLPRETAARYRAGLLARQAETGTLIALSGNIIGGGIRGDGTGSLGVFLHHDPGDFLSDAELALYAEEDEDEDAVPAWRAQLANDNVRGIRQLRQLLAQEQEPLVRHEMYDELERLLYLCRNDFASALEEYDAACCAHDAELEAIIPALIARFGGIPSLGTSRQAVIRHTHAHDWAAVKWWTERGISLYADRALDPGSLEDLRKRRDRCLVKLAEPARRSQAQAPRPAVPPPDSDPEVLNCATCGRSFSRPRTRGRKPLSCPECRGAGAPSDGPPLEVD